MWWTGKTAEKSRKLFRISKRIIYHIQHGLEFGWEFWKIVKYIILIKSLSASFYCWYNSLIKMIFKMVLILIKNNMINYFFLIMILHDTYIAIFIYKLIKLGQRLNHTKVWLLPFTLTSQQGVKQLFCCTILHFYLFLSRKDNSLSDCRDLCHPSHRLQRSWAAFPGRSFQAMPCPW